VHARKGWQVEILTHTKKQNPLSVKRARKTTLNELTIALTFENLVLHITFKFRVTYFIYIQYYILPAYFYVKVHIANVFGVLCVSVYTCVYIYTFLCIQVYIFVHTYTHCILYMYMHVYILI
jgi:hypothetical protein